MTTTPAALTARLGDNLYRLTRADYDDGRSFAYTYDSVGNRLTQEVCVSAGNCVTTSYVYDIANRLISVNGTAYIWDNNGNLLNDGTNEYTYDAANRLTSVTGGGNTSSYAYNGLGDRVSQTVNGVTTNYTLDLNTGLTQVLSDGTNTYLYGNGRIGELQPGGFVYHLGDALGSVRQLADATGEVTLARSFEPFGSPLTSVGAGSSVFAFTGEQFDGATGLTFLRARFYASATGRFLTKDPSRAETNLYVYAAASPVLFTDPSGLCVQQFCFLFYFPGAGNDGTNYYANENTLLTNVSQKGGISYRKIWPFGPNPKYVHPNNSNPGQKIIVGDNTLSQLCAAYPDTYNSIFIDALSLVNGGSGNISDPSSGKAKEIADIIAGALLSGNYTANSSQMEVDFLAYSAGGQVAYGVAQELKGYGIEVDNLALLGTPLRASRGWGNIGKIYDMRGTLDITVAQLLHQTPNRQLANQVEGLARAAIISAVGEDDRDHSWAYYNQSVGLYSNPNYQRKDLAFFTHDYFGDSDGKHLYDPEYYAPLIRNGYAHGADAAEKLSQAAKVYYGGRDPLEVLADYLVYDPTGPRFGSNP
ncbi:MAG: hypothetical protein HYZ49_10705 [Chloroflexi bacterium]|nr:hypothetical protein [Chloroflexota bacterium]